MERAAVGEGKEEKFFEVKKVEIGHPTSLAAFVFNLPQFDDLRRTKKGKI